MKHSLGLLSAMVVFTAFVAAPAHVYVQSPATQTQDPHVHQGAADAKPATTPEQSQGMMMTMMADMQAADAKLNALVKTMNAAKGADKTDAIAALLTALVKEHGAMHSSMMNMMMGNMGMMNSMPAGMGKAPDKAKP